MELNACNTRIISIYSIHHNLTLKRKASNMHFPMAGFYTGKHQQEGLIAILQCKRKVVTASCYPFRKATLPTIRILVRCHLWKINLTQKAGFIHLSIYCIRDFFFNFSILMLDLGRTPNNNSKRNLGLSLSTYFLPEVIFSTQLLNQFNKYHQHFSFTIFAGLKSSRIVLTLQGSSDGHWKVIVRLFWFCSSLVKTTFNKIGENGVEGRKQKTVKERKFACTIAKTLSFEFHLVFRQKRYRKRFE